MSSSSLGLCGGRVIGIIGDYASILIEAMIAPSWDTNLTLDNTLKKKQRDEDDHHSFLTGENLNSISSFCSKSNQSLSKKRLF